MNRISNSIAPGRCPGTWSPSASRSATRSRARAAARSIAARSPPAPEPEREDSMSPTETAIRDYLLAEVLYDKNLPTLAADDNLIEKGLLDSLAILRVVSFCEEQFGVTIPDTEVLPDNMESVGAIAKVVEKVRKN